MEAELAELKKANEELRAQLRREQERTERLEQTNEQAAQKVDDAIARIKTLLAS